VEGCVSIGKSADKMLLNNIEYKIRYKGIPPQKLALVDAAVCIE